MSDIRERVARAICRQNLVSTKQPDDAETLNHYWRSFLPEADAALSECGYADMREALEHAAKVFDALADCDDLGPFTTPKVMRDHAHEARAALQKARGGT